MKSLNDIRSFEEQALLLLCRPRLPEEEISLLGSNLSKITGWDSFIKLINEHGITALSRHRLKESGLIEIVPEPEREILHKGWLASLARNSKIFSFFNEVAGTASEYGIKIIPVKGLFLEKTVYGDCGLRQMNDLDILTSQEDAFKLREILLQKGFESIPFISPIHSYFMHSYGKHMPEMYKNGLSLEIHFRLFRDRHNTFTKEMIDSSREPFSGGSRTSFSPPPAHNFLYLVKHLLWHEKTGNSQLRLYCDLVFLIDKYGKNILNENLFSLANRINMENDLRTVLRLLQEFFGIETGETGIVPQAAANEFLKFLSCPKNNPAADTKGPFSDQIENIEGLHHKILYVLGMLFPSFTFVKWRYGAKNNFQALFCYPKRWFDFLRTIVQPLLRRG